MTLSQPIPPRRSGEVAALALRFRLLEPEGSLTDVALRRRGTLTPDVIEQRVQKAMSTEFPPLESLVSPNANGITPPARERYVREREDYAADLRAWLALVAERQDLLDRTIRLEMELHAPEHAVDEVYVRIIAPPGIRVMFDGEEERVDAPQPPSPVTARSTLIRPRFSGRFRATGVSSGAAPSTRARFPATDESTVVTYGPERITEPARYFDALAFRFASWERVRPFTITHELSVRDRQVAHGELTIGARRA